MIQALMKQPPLSVPVEPLLQVRDLSLLYGPEKGCQGVSFDLYPGEVLGIVGESGSGKPTTAQAVIGLLAAHGHREHGSIRLQGTEVSGWPAARWNAIRGRVVSLVPQDPTMSLNPVRTVGDQVG